LVERVFLTEAKEGKGMGMIRIVMVWVVLLGISPAWGVQQAFNNPEVVHGVNTFGLSLLQDQFQEPRNLFLSPFSLASALAMTWCGATGTTATAFAATLQARADAFDTLFALGQTTRRLRENRFSSTFVAANGLWTDRQSPLQKEFTDQISAQIEAELRDLDFRQDPETARQMINTWAYTATRGSIANLLEPGVLSPQTRLVLTNAVYFKGSWDRAFPTDSTASGSFSLLNGEKAEASFMSQTGEFPYLELPDRKMVEIPYLGNTMSMVIVLPRAQNGLIALLKDATIEGLVADIARMDSAEETRIEIPRFRMESSFALKDPLTRLGLGIAFSDQADFTPMTGARDLKIGAVTHKTFVEVNEEGTEAAAASAVNMELRGPPEDPREFTARHPFLFLIRDRFSGTILFLGTLVDPRS
jgi:serpin B